MVWSERVTGTSEIPVNSNIAEYFGIRLSVVRTTGVWYKVWARTWLTWLLQRRRQGKEKVWFRQTDFGEILNNQVTPFEDGRRNTSSHAGQPGLTLSKWGTLLWTRFPMNRFWCLGTLHLRRTRRMQYVIGFQIWYLCKNYVKKLVPDSNAESLSHQHIPMWRQ